MQNLKKVEEHSSKRDTFTMFNSKEIHRAIFTLSPKACVIFICMVRLIVEFKFDNIYRKLSIKQILDSLPFEISAPTLKKYLDELRSSGFIKSFQDVETKHHVYSLMQQLPTGTGGYSSIDDTILTDHLNLIGNALFIKLYVLIYLNLMAFTHKDGFTKTLRDLCQMMGLKPIKGNKDKVIKGLEQLNELGLINYTSEQKHIFLNKKFTISLKNDVDSEDALNTFQSSKSAKEQLISQRVRKNLLHDSKEITTRSESFDDTYIKKESISKNQNISKKESLAQTINFTLKDSAENEIFDNLIFLNFNFFGMDKLSNPLTEASLKALLKRTSLPLNQIQSSIERFVKAIELSKTNTIKDPVAFFCNHLIKNGEYFPQVPQEKKEVDNGKNSEIPLESKILELNSNDSKTLNFNLCGLDQLENPLHIGSIVGISKSTNLTIEQIQRSVRRFSEYINSNFYCSDFGDPIAFLCTHLRKFGEYIPPEGYVQNGHKEEHQNATKEDYDNVISMALEFVENKTFENDEETLTTGGDIQAKSESRIVDLALEQRAKNELMGIFPKRYARSQSIKQLYERYLDRAIELIEQNIPLTIDHLAGQIT